MESRSVGEADLARKDAPEVEVRESEFYKEFSVEVPVRKEPVGLFLQL